MAQNHTLQNFIAISQSLKHIKIDCHNLVRTVRRVTQWTVTLEHHGTSNPPAPKDIRNVLNTDPNPLFHILTHSSRQFTVLILNSEADMNRILTRASQFAPQYTIRRIQQEEEPAPKQTFSSSPKVSEIAELQCFLKAYFYKICDERVEDKARRQRLKEAKKAKTREFPGWQPPATSKKKTSHKEAGKGGESTKAGDATQHPPATGSGHSNGIIPSFTLFLPRPLLRPRPTQPPPTTAGKRRNRSESPPNTPPPHSGAPSSNHINSQNANRPQPTISGHSARQMAVEIYQEVVDAAASGVPLMLELLGSSAEEEVMPPASSSQASTHSIVRGLAYLDAGMATQLESAIRLRRLIETPTEPRLISYDIQVRAALDRARERLRKAKEEEDR